MFPSPNVSGLWDNCPTDVICDRIRSQTPANKNSPSAMITGSTLDSVSCASTAAGGVSCTDVSAAHPLITLAICAIAINFINVIHPLLTMRHPDKETCFKSKCLQNQSAKIRKNPFILKHISQIPLIYRPISSAPAVYPRRPKRMNETTVAQEIALPRNELCVIRCLHLFFIKFDRLTC